MIRDKKICKRIVFTLLLSLSLLCFTACGRSITEAPDSVTAEKNVPENPANDPDITVPEVEGEQPQDGEQPQINDKQEVKQINIYGMDEESLESEPATATITGEVNAESIVQAVVDNYKGHSIEIGIYSIVEEGDKVIVSFKNGTAPLANVGTNVEETILNGISDSLMDNLSTCQAVIFRGEDVPYESGHYAFGLDEVYASE